MTQYNRFNYPRYIDNIVDNLGYSYPSTAGAINYDISEPYIYSEYSMTKKVAVEVEGDTKENTKNLVIKKQAEVWVWDDKVYATKALALADQKRAVLIDALVEAQFTGPMGYSKGQRDTYRRQMLAGTGNYNFNQAAVFKAFESVLSELSK